MRRDGAPLAVSPCPDVGVPAGTSAAVGLGECRARMDDRHVSNDANDDVMRGKMSD